MNLDKNNYEFAVPLFERIDELLKHKDVIVAIEGGSASGKTTLSAVLGTIYDCTILHMDDFFLRPEQRTPERYEEIGGNIDRERFMEEILIPLKAKKTLNYRKFDCTTMTLCPGIPVIPKKLTVIEGVYSMHPAFSDYYDISVFLDISSDLQKKRIAKRNTKEMFERFYKEWIPLEEVYFAHTKTKQRSDFPIVIKKSSCE